MSKFKDDKSSSLMSSTAVSPPRTLHSLLTHLLSIYNKSY